MENAGADLLPRYRLAGRRPRFGAGCASASRWWWRTRWPTSGSGILVMAGPVGRPLAQRGLRLDGEQEHDALHPEYPHIYDQVQLETEHALRVDSLAATHPIHVEVQTAEEANALFDDITYLKGAAVLRCLSCSSPRRPFAPGCTATSCRTPGATPPRRSVGCAEWGLGEGRRYARPLLVRSRGLPALVENLRRVDKQLQVEQRQAASVLPMKRRCHPGQIPFCYRLGEADGGATQACQVIVLTPRPAPAALRPALPAGERRRGRFLPRLLRRPRAWRPARWASRRRPLRAGTDLAARRHLVADA